MGSILNIDEISKPVSVVTHFLQHNHTHSNKTTPPNSATPFGSHFFFQATTANSHTQRGSGQSPPSSLGLKNQDKVLVHQHCHHPMMFLGFRRSMSRVIGQFYVYMWCFCWIIGNWLPCYRPGQAGLTQTHGCPLCSQTSLVQLFFRQEFSPRSTPVLLNFKQYLKPNKTPVTWTVCFLPCRAAVCGSLFAKHEIQAQEATSMCLKM